ncbi:hypothetical protein [Roseomonas sp. KE2513]|uniref:hypothetical protein n=1 Tax=Roseomonas sp. KE2513 TaxID=2479202 RepID=UPI0018DFCDF3|nr:hypothetical protein [Roseomonas sp. KE2513]
MDLAGIGEWAWARHHNVLSWYVRPLFLLPFCFFAWRRSGLGIAATLVALATSMAWFPVPAEVSPGVRTMLAAERDYLLGPWAAWKVALALLVPLTLAALGAAFWWRAWGLGLAVVNATVLAKIGWSFAFSPLEGALAHLPPASVGLVVVNVGLLLGLRFRGSMGTGYQGRE